MDRLYKTSKTCRLYGEDNDDFVLLFVCFVVCLFVCLFFFFCFGSDFASIVLGIGSRLI